MGEDVKIHADCKEQKKDGVQRVNCFCDVSQNVVLLAGWSKMNLFDSASGLKKCQRTPD